jgi:hypothetical protein
VFFSWFAPTTICFLFVFFSWLMVHTCNHRLPLRILHLVVHTCCHRPPFHGLLLVHTYYHHPSLLVLLCFTDVLESWIFLFFFVSVMFWVLGTKLGNYMKHTLKLGIGILRKWIKNRNQNQLLKF